MDWRITYSDGSTFSSDDGSPADAPGRGVVLIAQADERVGRRIARSMDYYVYDVERFGGWQGVDNYGLWDYLSDPGLKIVKFGRWVPNDQWERLLIAAQNEPGLPPKSARLPDFEGRD